MALTKEEKAERSRQRMIETSKQYQLGTYAARFVAPVFQKMVRAETAAVCEADYPAIVDGAKTYVRRKVGQCVCITCGKVQAWKSNASRYSGMHTGHFLASRRNSILFAEENVAPQCSACNYFRGGAPQEFRLWMELVRGPETIARLEALKATTRKFTREELVDMKIEFAGRLKSAEESMRTPNA